MTLIVVFGLPGAGKTYVSKILQKHFGYFFYDGDLDLPEDMKSAISKSLPITDDMREVFFANIVSSIKKLQKTHSKIVIAQTFIKEKYRNLIKKEFPTTQFILVHATETVRTKRITERVEYPLDLNYVKKMVQIFETPHIDHVSIDNETDGEEEILKQLSLLGIK